MSGANYPIRLRRLPGKPAHQPDAEGAGLALCLSGGGFRAALFHLGALRRLNEVGLLSQMRTISSVSGGSIANALLARLWRKLKPDQGRRSFMNFPEYEDKLREFCSRDIRTGPLLLKRADPRNWLSLARRDYSATNLLADQYRQHLVGDLRLEDLAAIRNATGTNFIFNTSNVQTGVDFTFGPDGVSDWKLGDADTPNVLVAEAVAASSAFPLAFPPLVLELDPNTFRGGAFATVNDSRVTDLRRRIVLTDGGVYDNLGLEPVWRSHKVVFCSDGGKPFAAATNPAQALPRRLIRIQDVIGNQALAVRKRWLIASYDEKVFDGAYWGIGTDINEYQVHGPGYGEAVLDGLVLARLRAVRTDFDAFTEGEQLVLMNHGWALADAALRTYVSAMMSNPVPPGIPPSERLLADAAMAASVLKDSHRIYLLLGHELRYRLARYTASILCSEPNRWARFPRLWKRRKSQTSPRTH